MKKILIRPIKSISFLCPVLARDPRGSKNHGEAQGKARIFSGSQHLAANEDVCLHAHLRIPLVAEKRNGEEPNSLCYPRSLLLRKIFSVNSESSVAKIISWLGLCLGS